ncbi:2-isopropylmalate synthase [Candidatus Gastranaerophilus sp. (ex Termes propinquus)]|nr:2-isopropylmalate synthase [Candidatus Gastranaerophilus sp. (ex Termes propinquus)]
MRKVEIYDTTLRDGAQSEGINYSVSDKLKIIKKLDSLGVDYIEAGWPGANPTDVEVFKEAKSLKLAHAKIAAFGCTRKPNVSESEDKVLAMLAESGAEIITIFGKSWDFHVTEALCTTLDENLAMIEGSIKYLQNYCHEVFFDAEHFFDGYKHNPNYALEVVKTAHKAGATRIILCDTNGGCINNEVFKITKEVVETLGDAAQVGIHAHNDSDLAVANSLAAVDAGAMQVQGTMNGYGERCGNANLCTVIPNLQIKKGYNAIGESIVKLTEIARQVAEISNISLKSSMPFVGRSAFAHKAGVHASGVRKNSQTYEHILPESVGNMRRFLISDQAGAATIREKIENLPFVNEISNEQIKKVIEKIKTLEWQGFAFEGADASFEILTLDALGKKPYFFDLLGFRVIGDTVNACTVTEASVKIKVGETTIHTVAEGDGPVNALDIALRKALSDHYPQINNFRLSDFKVRILDSTEGTAATVRVNIESTDGINKWDTVGVNTNIIEASYGAIVDSVIYGLMLARNEADEQ